MYCPPPAKHGVIADDRSYYVGFKAVSVCVARHVQHSPLAVTPLNQ